VLRCVGGVGGSLETEKWKGNAMSEGKFMYFSRSEQYTIFPLISIVNISTLDYDTTNITR
jgi:hypothetical protein